MTWDLHLICFSANPPRWVSSRQCSLINPKCGHDIGRSLGHAQEDVPKPALPQLPEGVVTLGHAWQLAACMLS